MSGWFLKNVEKRNSKEKLYYVPLMSYEAAPTAHNLKRQKYNDELTSSLEKASLPTSRRLKAKSFSLLQQGPRSFIN